MVKVRMREKQNGLEEGREAVLKKERVTKKGFILRVRERKEDR